MDAHSLELSAGYPFPRPSRTPRRARDGTAATPPSEPRGGAQAPSAASTRRLLHAYTAASILLGLGALAWTTLTVPLLSAIDPGLSNTALAGPEGGLLLWIAFGLIGSLRVLPIPGSSAVWTFHFPFVAAAMALGGPTAGAWVGFLATLERRELESQPWYGTLANHAVMALGAVIGGLSVLVVQGALLAVGAGPGTASVVGIAAGTLVLALVTNGMGAATIMLREHLAPIALLDILIRSFGRMTLAEIGLACVFTVAYVAVGWWAPAALAVVILLIWPGEGFEGIDPLMRLPRHRQFQQELESVLGRTRRGLATGGLLLMIDLDGFGLINKEFGMHVGDEVLAEIGDRLRSLVRTTDLVGRLGGDELAMYYRGDTDLLGARRMAEKVEQAIRRPITTSAGTMHVGVSIGALNVPQAPDIPAGATLLTWADREMQVQKRLQKAGRARSGIRFHPYGSRDAAPLPGDDRTREPGGWPSGRLDRVEVGAFLVAASAVLVTAIAWVVRLTG